MCAAPRAARVAGPCCKARRDDPLRNAHAGRNAGVRRFGCRWRPRVRLLYGRATFLISVRKVDSKESSKCSPVAQSVERTAVNRQVAGSNPARGAKYTSFIFKAFFTSGVSRSNIIDCRLWGLLWGVARDHRIIDVEFQGRDSRAARPGADMRVAAEHSRVHVTGELSNGLLRYSGVFRQPSDEGVARIIEPAADS